jgi:hypothetical protein
MKFILLLRNFCYSFLLKKHGETYAKREYKFVFGGILSIYYIIILTILATLQFKFKFAFIPLRRDLVSIIFNGVIFFSPLAIFLYIIHRQFPPIDTIDVEESSTCTKKRAVIIFLYREFYCFLSFLI